jgi:hypothetical protein
MGERQQAVRKDLYNAVYFSSLTTFPIYFRTLLFTRFIIVGMFKNFFVAA